MKKIVLIGGGGHCNSVLDTLLELKLYDEIVITDAQMSVGQSIHGCRIIGNDSILPELKKDGFEYAFITVGGGEYPNKRVQPTKYVSDLGFKIPSIIDYSAKISKSAVIGCGVFVGKNAIVNAEAKIGNHCIINTGAIVEHECEIGEFSHISVGTILCGKVKVGSNTFVGAGSTVIHNKTIGSNVVVGANSTVIGDIISGNKVFGIVK